MDNNSTIVLLRHRQILLRLLPLKVIVNGKNIYEFKEKKPLIIYPESKATEIEVVNGFHKSNTILVQEKTGATFYQVKCRVDNIQFISALLFTLIFFVIFISTGNRLFMIFANIPITVLLFLVYYKRSDFIRLVLLENE